MKSNRTLNFTLSVYVLLVFVFVFAPIFFSVIFSFNSQRFPTIPLGNFSTEWYVKILNDPDIWQAAFNSLIVSSSTAVIATILGFCTAYSDYRYNFKFKGPYLALILLPPTIPLIIMALAMLAWLSKIGMSGQLWSIILAHSVLCAPFAMAVIRLRLNQMDPDLESASWNLGGTEWATMRHVIIPFCKPSIISALCLSAAVSFDEFAVSWFVSGLNKTLPVMILEIVQGNIDPQVNAIGSFVFLISMTLVILAQVFFLSRQMKGT
ncbi:MAG TPA: ABC transporter permease [Rhodobacteraceae bacterium]|nr:ABC transporter permease [Amylibacter sp.]MDG1236638.1 ABC transporter permease [Amylibacter sp.]MDG1997538.1 ABC transporter permease [Amylibacter sp.]HAD28771.1 ABC transporter permease [Paracoccaceae bacterium]|tara:strand:+ start:335 stop:1129 length:795 start_codon:yes stop_codon:yes gene_type:complete